jgi:molecular chaperone DnaK
VPVGIDLGTTQAKVAWFDGARVALAEDRETSSGPRAGVPLVVAFDERGALVVGEAAKRRAALSPESAIVGLRGILGLRHDDVAGNRRFAAAVGAVEAGADNEIVFVRGRRRVSARDALAAVLRYVASVAEACSGRPVGQAALTVPEHLSQAARRDLLAAGESAGLTRLTIVSEPVAAVTGAGIVAERQALLVGVCDFGGGSFDASVVRVAAGGCEVLGAASDRTLGGADVDRAVAERLARALDEATAGRLVRSTSFDLRLAETSEEGKRRLTWVDEVDLLVPTRDADALGAAEVLAVPMRRAAYAEILRPFLERALETFHRALGAAGASASDLDRLVLAGGMCLAPAVREALERFAGRPAVPTFFAGQPAVVGAALAAASAAGLEIPAEARAHLGAPRRLGRHIGLALADGTVEPIVDASLRPPAGAYRLFCTSRDDQTTCRLQLVEGAVANLEVERSIGAFVIEGLPPRKAGDTRLDVYFEVDALGTLAVTAQDRTSGQRAHGYFEVRVE